jgi:prepilin-type N-terminal cleavage/methylation domain-containing protein
MHHAARIPVSRRAGFTLLEVMFASAVLAIAISGAASAMISAIELDRVNRETALATQAARAILEQVQDADFAEVYALYNQDPADDPPAAVATNGVPGPSFQVAGLSAQPADPDGNAGELIFPAVLDVVTGQWELREDVVDAALGLPGDIDGDGFTDDLDHSGDYRMLPVRIRVQWEGVTGPRTMDLVTILSSRE